MWLNVLYKAGAAACPVIPGFPLQAATNEAHLPSRENKAEPHSQSSICCYIGGLWIGVWAMSVDWRRAVWTVMCSGGDVSPALPKICSKVEYREHFLFLAQKPELKCHDKRSLKKKKKKGYINGFLCDIISFRNFPPCLVYPCMFLKKLKMSCHHYHHLFFFLCSLMWLTITATTTTTICCLPFLNPFNFHLILFVFLFLLAYFLLFLLLLLFFFNSFLLLILFI